MQSEKFIVIADFQDQFQQQDIQFLYFKTDQVINVYQKFENGWWYGGYNHENQELKGFFPSNFIKQMNEQISQEKNLNQDIQTINNNNNKQQSENQLNIQKILKKDDNDDNNKIDKQQQKEDGQNNWLKYVKDQLKQGELKVKNEIYDKIKTEESQIKQSSKFDPNFIIGYKKRKVEEKGKEGVIAIKDQSQVAKAYRQMYSYFDYEDWIEQRNLQGNKKAKADLTKKKIKKNNFKIKQ